MITMNFVAIPNITVQGSKCLYRTINKPNLIYVMWAMSKMTQIESVQLFTIDLLLRVGEQPVNKKSVEAIKSTLLELERLNLIQNMETTTNITEANKNTFLCYGINWFLADGTNVQVSWFKLYDHDVMSILKGVSTNRNNDHFTLTTFCNLVSRMNVSQGENNAYCYPSLKTIMIDTGHSKSRVEHYLKSLALIGILHYKNSGDWFNELSGHYTTGQNFYCRDSEGWEEMLNYHVETHKEQMLKSGYTPKSFEKANVKRTNTVKSSNEAKFIEEYFPDYDDNEIWM